MISTFACVVVKQSGSSRGLATGSTRCDDSGMVQFCRDVPNINLSYLYSFRTLMMENVYILSSSTLVVKFS